MQKKSTVYDAHFHIIDNQFPLVANHGYTPEPYTVEQYLERMSNYDLMGGTLVSGSFQPDYAFMEHTLKKLGDGFVGVIQADQQLSDEQIVSLAQAGVRGIRFNIKRTGAGVLEYLPTLAHRVFDIASWHTELYIDSKDLPELTTVIADLPCAVIDHLGLSEAGFKYITHLIEQGVYVKATGFGRLDFSAKAAIINLYSINPKGLIFGTDLPSTRAPTAYCDQDCALIVDALGEAHANDVLYANALELYRIDHLQKHQGAKQKMRFFS